MACFNLLAEEQNNVGVKFEKIRLEKEIRFLKMKLALLEFNSDLRALCSVDISVELLEFLWLQMDEFDEMEIFLDMYGGEDDDAIINLLDNFSRFTSDLEKAAKHHHLQVPGNVILSTPLTPERIFSILERMNFQLGLLKAQIEDELKDVRSD